MRRAMKGSDIEAVLAVVDVADAVVVVVQGSVDVPPRVLQLLSVVFRRELDDVGPPDVRILLVVDPLLFAVEATIVVGVVDAADVRAGPFVLALVASEKPAAAPPPLLDDDHMRCSHPLKAVVGAVDVGGGGIRRGDHGDASSPPTLPVRGHPMATPAARRCTKERKCRDDERP